jgi:hypothetical protein
MLVLLVAIGGSALAAAPAGAQTAPYGPAACTELQREMPVRGGLPVTVTNDIPFDGAGVRAEIRLDGTLLATVLTDASGRYSYSFTPPGSPEQIQTLTAPCGLVVQAGNCDNLTQATAPGGARVIVREQPGLLPGTDEVIRVDGTVLTVVRTDGAGRFRYEFTAPGPVTTRHLVEVSCGVISVELAPTGLASAATLTRTGLGLLGGGTALVLAAGRRRKRSSLPAD